MMMKWRSFPGPFLGTVVHVLLSWRAFIWPKRHLLHQALNRSLPFAVFECIAISGFTVESASTRHVLDFARKRSFSAHFIPLEALLVSCVAVERQIVALIGIVLFWCILICLFCQKLLLIGRLSLESGSIGPILSLAGSISLNRNFVGHILGIVLCISVQLCSIWLIGVMLLHLRSWARDILILLAIGGLEKIGIIMRVIEFIGASRSTRGNLQGMRLIEVIVGGFGAERKRRLRASMLALIGELLPQVQT